MKRPPIKLPDLSGLRRYLPEEEILRRYIPDYLLPRRQHGVAKAQGEGQAILSSEDWLGFDRPRGGVLWLKDGSAAKILAVNSINLDLRTSIERDTILNGEKELLNALSFPVQRLIYAEPLDLHDYLQEQQIRALSMPTGRRREFFLHHLEHLDDLVREQRLVRWRRFLILHHLRHVDRHAVQSTLEKRAKSLMDGLYEKCKLTAISLDDFGLAHLLDILLDPQRAMTQRLQPEALDTTEIDAELAVPLNFSAEDYFQAGNNYARMFMVTGYPHSPEEGWIDDLYQWHPSVSVSQHLEPANGNRLIKELNNTIKESEARLAGQLSHDKRKIEEQRVEDADRLIGELAVGNHRVIDFSMYLRVSASRLDELDRLSAELEGYITGKHLSCRVLKWQEMIEGFRAWLPLGLNEHRQAHRHQIPAAGVASTFPWSSAELTQNTGRFRGINLHTLNVCVLDPEALPNPHEAVLAYSGGGKSVELHLDMLHRWAAGRRLLCLDPERDKGYICRITGGQMVRFGFGAGNIINPMQARRRPRDPDQDDGYGDGADAEETTNSLQAQILRQGVLLSLILSDVKVEELAFASRTMMKLYQQHGITLATDPENVPTNKWPTWNELAPLLMQQPETKRLGAALSDWTDEGPFAGVMNGHTTVKLDSDFVVLDVADLKMNPAAQRPVFYLTLTYLWDEIDRDWDEPKDLYCDEMGILVDSQGGLQASHIDMALWFLWMISKCARKRNCRLKCATQNPNDFLSGGQYAIGILENCHTLVLGLQKKSSIQKLRQVVDLSEQEEAELLKMPPSNKLFVVGMDRALVKVVGSEAEMAIADRRTRMALRAKQQKMG
jgi:conjugal transfer ATP-binding protein TraC